MTTNELPLTHAHWRRLAPELRVELRQVLGGRSTIVGRQVLDVARALCQHGAYELAWQLSQGLDGEPLTPTRAAAWGC